MTAAWTIRSKPNPAAIRRPASLSSLPDLSDNLEIENCPYSGCSTLFNSPGNFHLWGHNSSDFLNDCRTCRHHSNISVAFLGSRIRRQYRSSFVISDDKMIGVTRCETFQPEDAKADVRVSLSVQGPPNGLIASGRHHSRSAPSLVPISLKDNYDWACLMLTTDRPRDSELVGRIGSRNYFTSSECGTPYFHRRITPMQKEEEYIFSRTSPVDTNASLDGGFENQVVDDIKENLTRSVNLTALTTDTGSDAEPSTERVEKDTRPLLSRHQEGRSSVVSPFSRISLNEKEPSFLIPESQSPCTQQTSDYLPSTERSESIIYLRRTKSESLDPKSSVAPSLEAVKANTRAGVGERSTPQVDNTLSLHTDFEEEEEENYDKGTEVVVEEEMATKALSTIHHAAALRAQNSVETASAFPIPFISPNDGVVSPFRGVGDQELGSGRHSQVPIKSTILYTSLQMNTPSFLQAGVKSTFSVPGEMQLGTIDVECEGSKVKTLQDAGDTELNSIVPLPRKRKRAFQRDGEEVEDASQTDESLTTSGTSVHASEKGYYAGGSEQSVDSTPRLPPRPEKRSIQWGSGPSISHRSDCSNQPNPEEVQSHGENTKPNQNVKGLVIQPDNALSHGNLFRSPFDPRSEDDLVSSTHGGSESGLTSGSGRRQRRHSRGCPEDGSETELSFDGVKLSAGFGRRAREHRHGRETNSLNAYDVEPLPAPRHSRQQGSRADKELPRPAPVMNALKEVEEGVDDDDDDDDDGSWVDEESRLRPPALPVNLEAALAELPTEDPATRAKRLRPLQYPLYVNAAGDQDGIEDDIYDRNKYHGNVRPLRPMDQNIPEEELPDTLLIRTRRRTMSGVTGFLPRSSTLSSTSIWFGDHPVPTKTQIYAAEQSPLRLSSIQLQAQAEIARRRSRNNLTARSLISMGDGGSGGMRRSRSLERSRTLAPSSSAIYGLTGQRLHGGAPIVERAIKRHASKRDGYETLSLVHVPKLEEGPSSIPSVTNAEQRKLHWPVSSTSITGYWTSTGTSQVNGIRNRDKARSLIAQAAVDLAVHTHDPSAV